MGSLRINLRRVELALDHGSLSRTGSVAMCFSDKTGLRITPSRSIQKKSKQLVKTYEQEIDQMRKILGLKAEAIPLALMANAALWAEDKIKFNSG